MTAAQLLAELRRLDVELWADGERLRYRAPPGVLTDALRRTLRARRLELIDVLGSDTRGGPPLSSAQERIWFLTRLDPASPLYNTFRAIRIRGPLDVRALEGAVSHLVARHAILRTTCRDVAGRPVQHLAPPTPVTVRVIDLRGLPPLERAAELRRVATAEARRPIDLAAGPLLRLQLARDEDDAHLLLLVTHHFCADGWSVRRVLMPELASFYAAAVAGARPSLPPLQVQYADLAGSERRWLEEGVFTRQLAYWRQQLAGAPSGLDLPTDEPRPLVPTHRGSRASIAFPSALSDALRQLSRRHRVTLFTTLLAAFQTLLYRYSGQEDVVVGTAVANRRSVESERLIGPLVNDLVMRAQLGADVPFSTLLTRVARTVADGLAHQDLPFDRLVSALGPDRDLGRNPLFQVMFVLHHFADVDLDLSGLTLEPMPMDAGTSRFDLCLEMTDAGGQPLSGWLEYSSDLFHRASVERMISHYRLFLEAIVEKPDIRVGAIPLLTAAERQRVVVEWNLTSRGGVPTQTVHQLFEAQARRSPDRIAVMHAGQSVTYRELDERAERVAAQLRECGVRPDMPVGLCADRSVNMVTGVLGILKAGGAFMPLDPAYPADRLRFMLHQSGASCVVAHYGEARLPLEGAKVVAVDHGGGVGVGESDAGAATDPRSLAYVIYTSGSTGEPKAVAVEHRSLVNLLCWAHDVFGRDDTRVVLASTSMSFDLAVFELFYPLTCGGRVVVIESLLHLSESSEARHVTLVNTVPSVLAAYLATGHRLPSSVDTVTLAGETISPSLLSALFQHEHVQHVYNLYGPSEATVYATAERINPRERRHTVIGRPIANMRAYVVDDAGQPVASGIRGEIWLAGHGVARGYLGRPDLTTERFADDSFEVGAETRLYRTGDLGRHLPDGRLEYLGRRDGQVKVRGFRIELGEIEAVLLRHPAIREVLVAVIDQRLVAYVVPHAGHESSVNLRQFAQGRLPHYMVPSAFVRLAALPRTLSGKLDRRQLPAPTDEMPAVARGPQASNDLERGVAVVWCEVLGQKAVGVRDNFFDLGGHSLLLLAVQQRIRETLHRDVSIVDLFTYPTVESLATRLADGVSQVLEEGRADG